MEKDSKNNPKETRKVVRKSSHKATVDSGIPPKRSSKRQAVRKSSRKATVDSGVPPKRSSKSKIVKN